MLTMILLSLSRGSNQTANETQRLDAAHLPSCAHCVHNLEKHQLSDTQPLLTEPTPRPAKMTMRGDDEIPGPPPMMSSFLGGAKKASVVAPAECVGACHYKTRPELQEQTPESICRSFRSYCESPEMRFFCEQHGVNGASFVWNSNLRLSSSSSRIQQRNDNNKKKRRLLLK